ncbi:bifunctional glycosyltransferase/CDP-glycerol:glycerophosphate glycerophosphotransferase [Jeotgalibacillus proteolyticus]|nr:bifunctional glycosyltransferase family 2 protein/CDP-glycerol:glycerophosphate glycerophosphotransferase [Jeotgalibacillus proteolyticus]
MTQLTNNQRPKLSVVVIAYNNELYIDEALESLYHQTLKDIEVVVVNDFSTDNTKELIDEYVKDKPNFKAIHLQENSGGCSVPRNTGIENSTGEYVMFLDGDDWYTVDACEKMVEAIERTGSDFVGGQVIRTNNYEIWYHKQIYSKEIINTNIREFSTLFYDSLSVNKIYQRSFLDKNNLRFPEGIHYEDIVFTGKAYFLADAISFIPEPIYYWRVVENAEDKSITNRRFEFDNFRNRIVAHRMFDEFLRGKGDGRYQNHKNNKFLRHDLKLYVNDYDEFDEEYKEQFHQLIHEYLHEVMDEYAFINLPERERIIYYLLYIDDREAFQDYISYLNGEETNQFRIKFEGGEYYFEASVSKPNSNKFLSISSLNIEAELTDIRIDSNMLSFTPYLSVPGINPQEVHFEWLLKNRQTGHALRSKNKQTVKLLLLNMEAGNYYLSLHMHHQGNIHRNVIKKQQLENFANEEVENSRFKLRLFVNHKNTFGLKVLPKKTKDKVKLFILKRKKQKKSQNLFDKEKISQLYSKLPLKSNWILFESHMGKQYSDSPRAIYEELVKSGRNYKYIWSLENPDQVDIPGPAIKVKRNSMKHFYYLVRSKFWVDNQGLAHLAPKRKDQVYLQTWHGTPLKKMGFDQKKRPDRNEIAKLKRQTDAWDYFVSPNAYSTKIFRRAFRYHGEILETGYPRNDLLLNTDENYSIEMKKRFDIPVDKKLILFAPTFRDWDENSYQKAISDIHVLSQKINEETVILLRLHYLLSSKISQTDLPKNVINLSEHEDIQDLYKISDILITDYSSVMFDFAILQRPIILYCYDLEQYQSRRGMYLELEQEGPGPLCTNLDEVIYYISNPAALESYKKQYEKFHEVFSSLEDGAATRRVINKVFDY